jgi:hypothetical protein
MSVATVSSTKPQWRAVLRPKWLCWHAFAVVAFFGMLWLGDWQWHCALSGNTLSWAYTFEWPLFAIFGVVFWVRTVRDEVGLTKAKSAGASAPLVSAAAGAASAGDAGPASGAGLAAGAGLASGAGSAAGAGSVPNVAASIGPADDDAGLTGSHRRESESQEEYAARLIAEIRGPDRGWRRALR